MILLELAVLGLFAAMLIACILLNLSILYALSAGFFLFFLYSLKKGNTVKSVLHMCLSGIQTARNVLLTFLLIGMLTGLWRAAGTIPAIVCYAVSLITPSVFVLLTFLLCCLISFLTGTAFGSAATMGAVCMTMSVALNLSPAVIGGAILSGVYFGDRCSPVSTSALLTAEITGTGIFDNIKGMLKTALIPFLLSCAAYLVLGLLIPHGSGSVLDVGSIFSQSFRLGLMPLLPAAVILILAACRVSVRITMLSSIAVSIPICIFWQGLGLPELFRIMLLGYYTADAQLGAMLNGGGISSMLKVAAIVCLSSSYSGMFRETGLLRAPQKLISRLSSRSSAYPVTLITSIIAGAIACNQTLTIMLTHQLCESTEPDSSKFAIDLEDSAVIIAPLIPWSIAGGVPLASVGAPMISLLAACYLYLLPLCRLVSELLRKHVRHQCQL